MTKLTEKQFYRLLSKPVPKLCIDDIYAILSIYKWTLVFYGRFGLSQFIRIKSKNKIHEFMVWDKGGIWYKKMCYFNFYSFMHIIMLIALSDLKILDDYAENEDKYKPKLMSYLNSLIEDKFAFY